MLGVKTWKIIANKPNGLISRRCKLSSSKFLSGDEYTIADIGTFPWIARHKWHDIGLINYKHLTRWYIEISQRKSVKKGFAFMDYNEAIPKP